MPDAVAPCATQGRHGSSRRTERWTASSVTGTPGEMPTRGGAPQLSHQFGTLCMSEAFLGMHDGTNSCPGSWCGPCPWEAELVHSCVVSGSTGRVDGGPILASHTGPVASSGRAVVVAFLGRPSPARHRTSRFPGAPSLAGSGQPACLAGGRPTLGLRISKTPLWLALNRGQKLKLGRGARPTDRPL